VGDIDQETQDFARKAIRLRYQLLYGAHSWQESIRAYSISLNATDTFFLPIDAELIVWVTPSIGGLRYPPLVYREADWIEHHAGRSPYAGASGAVPLYFYRAPNLALPTTSPGVLNFTVKDTAAISLYIAGSDASGNPLAEKLSVNTTDPSNPARPVSTNSYSLVRTLSKTLSTYPVTVTAQDGTIAVMEPGASDLVFTCGVIWPLPSGSVDLSVGAKLRADILSDDMSVPRISRLWNALIAFTTASLYKRQRQLAKAQSENADAMQMVQAAVGEEKNQAAFSQQTVPVIYDGNFLPSDTVAAPTSSWPFLS
jgi:hypothetical protein